ncbi:hypothetical protein E1B28_006424 [Marasmius oreades]|uniref:Uncharacterized protein n=1 Tax=Marasmius oreades TaxID=181124 RepID=A0A9P7S5Z9_9AGAR|nr:uncharacterized protein E1B28_006424 [Marasmius oreades]KAG7095710.1 hypothetical protein E1B28_006424 [Marasmius oreades]
MQRSSSSLKAVQKTISRSLVTSSASRRISAVQLPLGGTAGLFPRFAGLLDDAPLDGGNPRTGLGSDFHTLPAPTLFDGPARRPRVQTLWPACHISLSQLTENQGAVEIFDGPSHYHRSYYGPPQRKQNNMFTYALGAAIAVGGSLFLNLH